MNIDEDLVWFINLYLVVYMVMFLVFVVELSIYEFYSCKKLRIILIVVVQILLPTTSFSGIVDVFMLWLVESKYLW